MPELEHERGFTGTIRNTIADSASSWRKEPAATGPNIVVIVLDDVGYSQLGCYGSSIDTPALDRLAEQRTALLQLPRHSALFPHPSMPAHRTQPPRRRHVACHRDGQRLPQHRRLRRARGRHPGRNAQAQRLSHDVRRQMASRPQRHAEPRRTLRSLAAAARLRPLLRIPIRRDQPVESRAVPRQRANRRTAPRRIRRRLSPLRSDRRPRHALVAPARLGR